MVHVIVLHMQYHLEQWSSVLIMQFSITLFALFTAFVSLYFTNGGYGNREKNSASYLLNNCTVEEILCGSLPNKTIKWQLLPGFVYTINPGDYCEIENVSELTIRGKSSSNRSVIQCLHDDDIISRGFAFINAQNVLFENIDFIDCGTILPEELLIGTVNTSAFYFGPGQASVIFCNHCTNFKLHNVKIYNYTGYAFVGVNTLGDTLLDNVSILNNNRQHTDKLCHRPNRTHVCKGSGVLFMLVEEPSLSSTIKINNTIFLNNTADHAIVDESSGQDCVDTVFDHLNSAFKTSYVLPSVGAVTIVVDKIKLQDVNIKFTDSHFINNHGQCFGAVMSVLLSQSNASNMTFSRCTFSENTPSIVLETEEGRNYFGSDITLYLKFHGDLFTYANCLSVEDSIFLGSERFRKTPRMSLLHFAHSNGQCTANITRVTSSNSKFLYAFAIDQSSDKLDIRINGMNITGRTSDYSLQSLTLDNGLLTFRRTNTVVITGTDEYPCVFEELIGPVILGRVTDVILTGNVIFKNIKAASWAGGAAILLQTDSRLWLQEPLSAEFCNLTALYGGAIYAPERNSEFCVIQYFPLERVFYTAGNITKMNMTLTFTGNTATLAGNSLYIDPLWNCSFQLSPRIDISPSDVNLVYDTMFHFEDPVDNKLFEMTSSPRQVCICEDGITNTNISALNCNLGPHFVKRIMTYPGKQLSLNLIAVNDLHSATEGFLGLSPADSPQTLLFPITLQKCPIGFKLTTEGDCHCSPMLANLEIKCDIDTLLIERPENSWIGIFSEDEYGENVTIGYTNHCPTRYCRNSVTQLNISDPDYICIYNRTGVLCGQCPQNLSVVVGGPHCKECSNLWLLTIPLYALAGIILVFLLFALRMTMATGTIAGLIFYANLFNVNSFTFFGYKEVEWLKVFIAMLNLELGFPICLYDGFNELNRAYLSFIFPIYLWTIGLVLVIAARFSSRVANWTARTAIPVLVTLIHISFFKLLRSVVNGLTFSELTIEFPASDYKNRSMKVWYYDGSVEYLRGGHCVLFAIVLATLVFLISYIIVMTGVKYFTRFRIINRFQPLIDATCAPYKDKWRFWYGVRLWAIVIVDIAFAASRNKVYLFLYIQAMILMTLTFAQLAVMPYKSTANNILDLFFLADATLLTVTALYTDTSIPAASGVFAGVVFIAFWCIIGYHIWVLVEPKLPSSLRRRQSYKKLSASNIQDTTAVTQTSIHVETMQQHARQSRKYEFDKLRDSILESDSD